MKLIRLIVLLSLPVYLISCGTQQKMPNYLQTVTDTTGKGIVQIAELRIQKNDLLTIQVYSASTMPQISDAPYNLPAASAGSDGAPGASSGILVDANGNIEYPRIGLLKAEGLTRIQLADVIKRKINEKDSVLTSPVVIVRFQGFKVTVLGEVNSQGSFTVPTERITIMEAVGLAGGITDFGLKDAVKVVREIDGKREVGYVDLSSDKVFESPFYNLMQNDVVFVDPTKRKAKKADQEVVLRQAGFIISIITALAVVIRVFQ